MGVTWGGGGVWFWFGDFLTCPDLSWMLTPVPVV